MGKRIILLVFAVAFVLAFGSLGSVWAVSSETTGLTLGSFNSNVGKYADCGEYEVFVTDLKIQTYNDDGSFKSSTAISVTSVSNYVTLIAELNSTHVIVSTAYSATNYVSIYAFYFRPSTGLITVIQNNNNLGGLGNSAISEVLVTTSNGNIYAIVGGTNGAATHREHVCRIYPSYSYVGSVSDGTLLIFGPAIWVLSDSAPTTTCYVVCRDAVAGLRFDVIKIDLSTASFTLIGSGGVDFDWSMYVYFIGSRFDTNFGYSVLVCYPHITVAKQNFVEAISFNDTSVTEVSDSHNYNSAVNTLRPISAYRAGSWSGEFDLQVGTYNIVYVGDSYYMRYFQVSTSGYGTTAITVSILHSANPDSGYSYQARIHYYTSTNSAGGLQNPTSNVVIIIDHTANKCVADLWESTLQSLSYLFAFNPTASSTVDYDVTLSKNTAYIYTGELYFLGIRSGSGTYNVSTTGLSISDVIEETGTYSNLVTDASWSDGTIQFNIAARSSTQTIVYEGLRVSIDYGDSTVEYTHRITWVTPTPSGGTADFGGGFGSSMIIDYLVQFIFVFVPPFILTGAVGTATHNMGLSFMAFFVGLTMTSIIGTATGILPPYGIVILAVCVIGLVVMVLTR